MQSRVNSNYVVALGCLPSLQTLALYETRVKPFAGEHGLAWVGREAVVCWAIICPLGCPHTPAFAPQQLLLRSPATHSWRPLPFAPLPLSLPRHPFLCCAVDKLLAANPDLCVQGVAPTTQRAP
jgi:hypothetical protein